MLKEYLAQKIKIKLYTTSQWQELKWWNVSNQFSRYKFLLYAASQNLIVFCLNLPFFPLMFQSMIKTIKERCNVFTWNHTVYFKLFALLLNTNFKNLNLETIIPTSVLLLSSDWSKLIFKSYWNKKNTFSTFTVSLFII